MVPKYKRVLIKLSGEMLSAPGAPLDGAKIDAVAKTLAEMAGAGVEMGVVVGGGNILRGRSSEGMDRSDADHMGMLATVINALALKDAIRRAGREAVVMSAFEMNKVCDLFTRRDALRHLENGSVVIFSAGSGNPYFSTDTAAALRALEIDAEVLLCGKKCDGVYDKNPDVYDDAVKFDTISFDEVIFRRLEAMDQASMILCRDRPGGGLPVYVFQLSDPQNLVDAIEGRAKGTFIS